jgi:hypothetical protein
MSDTQFTLHYHNTWCQQNIPASLPHQCKPVLASSSLAHPSQFSITTKHSATALFQCSRGTPPSTNASLILLVCLRFLHSPLPYSSSQPCRCDQISALTSLFGVPTCDKTCHHCYQHQFKSWMLLAQTETEDVHHCKLSLLHWLHPRTL